MGVFRQSVALGIGASNNNVLAGSIYEFPTKPTRVVIAAVADQGDVRMGVSFGGRIIANQSETLAPLQPAAGQGPNIPDHVVIDEMAMPGERLVIALQGGAAASVTRIYLAT